jgi:hypothetical protein
MGSWIGCTKASCVAITNAKRFYRKSCPANIGTRLIGSPFCIEEEALIVDFGSGYRFYVDNIFRPIGNGDRF